MATFSKVRLSESVNGLGVLVVATATLGTTIHTAHATAQDEIWLYATNSHSAAVTVTVELGGVAAKDRLVQSIAVNPSGMVLLNPGGSVLTGSVVVTAFAGTANVIGIHGSVNRITA